MTWAAYGPQKPSSDGIPRHDVSEAVIRRNPVPAGQGSVGAAHAKRPPAAPKQDSNLRSRLRRPPVRSSEFVHAACLDSIAHHPGGRDHSAYIPDDEQFLCAAAPCRGWPASGPGRFRPGPWFLTGVSAVVSGVKRDFACTLAGALPPVLVVLRGTVALEAGGADTYTWRVIAGLEFRRDSLVR
jgi:hypothetical protein